jgi:hypothetical protein
MSMAGSSTKFSTLSRPLYPNRAVKKDTGRMILAIQTKPSHPLCAPLLMLHFNFSSAITAAAPPPEGFFVVSTTLGFICPVYRVGSALYHKSFGREKIVAHNFGASRGIEEKESLIGST